MIGSGVRLTLLVALIALPVQGQPSTTTRHELVHDDRERSYYVHLPRGYDATRSYPVVLVYHGGGGNARQIERTSGFSQQADEKGFIAVYPNGSGRIQELLLTWNCGGLPVYAVDHEIDDVGFTRAIVAELCSDHHVDEDRIYAVGISNGGMMAHRLACEAADIFAAICDIAGAKNFEETVPTTPVGVMFIHGTADDHVLYEGGRPRVSATRRAGRRHDTSVADGARFYIRHNKLEPTPQTTEEGSVRTDTYVSMSPTDDPVSVVVITLDGGTHTWPGGNLGRRGEDGVSEHFDATAATWEFFARHSK